MASTIARNPVIRYAGFILTFISLLGLLAVSFVINVHSATWLLGMYITAALGLVAWQRAKTSPLHQAYALYQAVLTSYLFNVWLLHVWLPYPDQTQVKPTVDLLARLACIGSIYMSVVLFHFTLRFSEVRRGVLLVLEYAGWLGATFFLIHDLRGTFVDDWIWTGTTWVPTLSGLT